MKTFLESDLQAKDYIESKLNESKEVKVTKDQANLLDYMLGVKSIPDNVFLHGRKDNIKDLKTGYVIQTTQDINVAESYGEVSIWALEAPKNSPKASDIVNDVYEKLNADKNYLSSEMEYYTDMSKDEFTDTFDVDSILDSAQFWDNAEAVDWFKNTYPKIYAVKLPYGHYGEDACVFLHPDKVKKYSISSKLYDEASDRGYTV